MPKKTLPLPWGDEEADVSAEGLLAIHKSHDGKGWILTHVPTLKCVLWIRLKREAVEARRTLESLDWSDWEAVEQCVRTIQNTII